MAILYCRPAACDHAVRENVQRHDRVVIGCGGREGTTHAECESLKLTSPLNFLLPFCCLCFSFPPLASLFPSLSYSSSTFLPPPLLFPYPPLLSPCKHSPPPPLHLLLYLFIHTQLPPPLPPSLLPSLPPPSSHLPLTSPVVLPSHMYTVH